MKKGWDMKKLSDVYQVGSSKRVLKSQWQTNGVPFYRGREVTRLAADGFVENELFISEEHFAALSKEYGVPKAGDIIITAIGTIGNAHVVRSSDRFYFKDASVLWMKRTADVSSEFVNLWLKSPSFFDQLDRDNGATVDTLTIQKLQSIKISLPPLTEQRRIVGLLGEAFAGLATSKANAQKNLQNTRALFESHLQSVFTQRGEDWLNTELGKVCERVTVGHVGITSPYYRPNGVLFLRTQNVSKRGLQLADVKYITNEFNCTLQKSQVRGGDVLMSRVLTNAVNCALVPDDLGPANCANVILVRPASKLISKFLIYYIQSPEAQKHLLGRRVGSAQLVVNTSVVKTWPIPVPPVSSQKRIVAKLDSLREETQRLASIYERKLAALEALKKSLLHQAFSGAL